MTQGMSEKGLQIRREMFGADFVEQRSKVATEFTRPFVEMVNNFAFGEIWSRPGLDRKTRSMITLAMLVAMNQTNEMPLHVRGALNNGVSKDEIREILLHAVAYAGFPPVLDAFRVIGAALQDKGIE
jgi:4-carboxymuconolactone decarboxylase